MTYLAALDVGASEIKTAIYDLSGRQVAQARRDCPTSSRDVGWAESPAEVLLEWPIDVLADALGKCQIPPSSVRAIGVTGSRATILPIGKNAQPLGPAILWHDRRSAQQAQELARRLKPADFFELTGVPLDPTPSVTKIAWLREQQPEVFSKAEMFASPQTAALHALVGQGWFCDLSYGSYFGLMDVKTGRWSPTLLQAAELPEEVLPKLVPPGAVVGTLCPAAVERTGLVAGTPVVASGSDTACFKLGAGVEGSGVACVYIGTAGVVGVIADHPVSDRRLTSCPAALPEHWDAEALLLTAGSAYRWLQKLLGDPANPDRRPSFKILDTLAGEVPPGSDGLTVVPHMAGAGSPLWNPDANGMILGLRLSHGPGHLARAVLEGVVYAKRHALEVLQESVKPVRQLQFTGGGAASQLWTQILADVTGLPVSVPSSTESTSLGAAIMAGVAAEVFGSVTDAVQEMGATERHIDPREENVNRYEKAYQAYRDALETCYRTAGE